MNASTRTETHAAGRAGRPSASKGVRAAVVATAAVVALVGSFPAAVQAQEEPPPPEVQAGPEGDPTAPEGEQPPDPGAEGQASMPTAVGDLAIEPGDVLLTSQEEGRVSVIDGRGDERPVIEGLSGPRGVVVLEDGSFVVAESGANRIVGIGGRYGETATVVAEYPFVGGMSISEEGVLHVTSYSEGRLSTVDLDSGAVTDVATGLVTPSGISERNGTVYVAELNNHRIVSVDPSGQVVPVVEDVGDPVGVSLGRGSDIYVADPTAGTLIVASGGEQRVLAEVIEARAVTTSPTAPLDGEEFRLLVAGSAGVVSVDPESGATEPISATVGIGSLAVLDSPRSQADPGDPDSSTTGSIQLQGIVETDSDGSGEPSGSPLTVVVLAFLILGGLAAFLAFQFRRVRGAGDEDEEGSEEQYDVRPLHETFGPCVNEELEVERAQAALASAAVQIEALRRRDESGAGVVAEARRRLAEARAAREELREAHPDRHHPIHEAAELLTTDDGREALEEYRSGGISPLELARRWRHAEETAAIAHVREAGDKARVADLTVPGPLEREAAAEVAEAEADVAQARADLERLLQREQQLRHNLLVAEAALETCRLANPVIQPEGEHHDPEQAEAWASPPAPVAAGPGAGSEVADGTGPDVADTEVAVPDVAVTEDPPAADGRGGPPDAPSAAAPDVASEPPPSVEETAGAPDPGSDPTPDRIGAAGPGASGSAAPAPHDPGASAVAEPDHPQGDPAQGEADAETPPPPPTDASDGGEAPLPLQAWVPPLPQRDVDPSAPDADVTSAVPDTELPDTDSAGAGGDGPEGDAPEGDPVPGSPAAAGQPEPEGAEGDPSGGGDVEQGDSGDDAGVEDAGGGEVPTGGATEPPLGEWRSPEVTPVTSTDRTQSLLLGGAEDITLPGYREKRIEAVRAVFDNPQVSAPERSTPEDPGAAPGGEPSEPRGSEGSAPGPAPAVPVTESGEGDRGPGVVDDDGPLSVEPDRSKAAPPASDLLGGSGQETGEGGGRARSASDVGSIFEGRDQAEATESGSSPAVLQWYASRKARRTDVPGVAASLREDPAPATRDDATPTAAEEEAPSAEAPAEPEEPEQRIDTSNLFRFPSRRRRR